jgi:hypothetical protein
MNKRFIILAGKREIDHPDNYIKYYNDLPDDKIIDRWNEYLGVPKHMLPIKGEPLIHRTQRILKDHGAKDILVKCDKKNKEKYLIDGSKWVMPLEIDHMYPDYEFVNCGPYISRNGITIILFGDVYYSESILKHMLVNTSNSWHFYARKRFSEITGSIYGEHFAWYFHSDHLEDLFQAGDLACLTTKELVDLSNNGIFTSRTRWIMQDSAAMTYRIMCGLDVKDPYANEDYHWIEWDDETEDFDKPEDWIKWSQRLPDLAF